MEAEVVVVVGSLKLEVLESDFKYELFNCSSAGRFTTELVGMKKDKAL